MGITSQDRLGLLLHDAARLLIRRFEARADGYGLSAAQWRLLFRAAREPGLPQARLAEILQIEPISVSRLLDRMEDADLIERRPAPDDRRVRLVFLSARAETMLPGVRGVAQGVYEEALAGLDAARREALIDALDRIVRNLAETDASVAEAATPAIQGANR